MQNVVSDRSIASAQIALPQLESAESSIQDLSIPELPIAPLESTSETGLELPQNPLSDFQLPSAQTPTKAEGEPLKDLKEKKYWEKYCNQTVLSDDTATALTACDRAITLDPDKANLWANRSKILLNLKQYTEALAAADYTLQLEPEHSLALTYRSMALTGLEQYRAAVDASELALKLNSYWSNGSPALAWHYRGLALYKLQDYQRALNAYERALCRVTI